MTEKEILDFQEQSGQQEFYLMLVGGFCHAYGHGAFALSRVTGYHVRRMQRKMGEVLVLGFNVKSIDSVCDRVRDAGGEIEKIDDGTWMFRGINGTPDLSMVCEPKKVVQTPVPQTTSRPMHPLLREVRRFNLSMSTPMDAMNLIARLQQQLQQEDTAENVQGADCPQGSAPGIACESPSGQGSAE